MRVLACWIFVLFIYAYERRERLTLIPPFPSFHISSRSFSTRLRTPIRISVFMLLSCASSMMMTEYLDNRKSVASSRRSTPSVMNLIDVDGETVASYRI